jgi:hypothetical protein
MPQATAGSAPLVGGVSQTGGSGIAVGGGVGGALAGAANAVGNALGGMYVDVSIPLSGQTPQYAQQTSTPIYYGGATTNTANTATTNNQLNNNAYSTTTNNNEVNNITSGIGGVRYANYSYTPPDPIQPKPLLGGLQAEGRAIAPNPVQLSDPGQGDINIARNYGGPVTGTLPAPSPSDPRVPLVQGHNTANTVQGSDQGYYASPGNVGSPQGPGLYPQGPQGIDPRVLQAYQNAQGVQNLYNIQQGMNPNLQNARNMQAMAQMMAMQRMSNHTPLPPQPLGQGPGWRNAMYRAAGGLNRNIAARNINAYNQQSANWREMYAQQQMNDRDAFGHFATLAGQQMSAEQQIYNTSLTQAVELTKKAMVTGDSSDLDAMIKSLSDNYPDPQAHAAATQGIAKAWQMMGVDPRQIAALQSTAGMVSQKAQEMSTGRQDRHIASQKRLEMQDMRKQLLGLQIEDKEFDNAHQDEKFQLDAAAKKAQIDGVYRRQLQWAIKDARSVDDDYNGMMKEIKEVDGNAMIPKNQKPQMIAAIKQRIQQRFGESDEGGVPKLVSDARRSINEYGQVLGVPKPNSYAPAPMFTPPPLPEGQSAGPAKALQVAPGGQGLTDKDIKQGLLDGAVREITGGKPPTPQQFEEAKRLAAQRLAKTKR